MIVNNGNNIELKCLMECLMKTEECLIETVGLSDTKFGMLLLMYTGNMVLALEISSITWNMWCVTGFCSICTGKKM